MANIITAMTPKRALLTQALTRVKTARDGAPLVEVVASADAVALLLGLWTDGELVEAELVAVGGYASSVDESAAAESAAEGTIGAAVAVKLPPVMVTRVVRVRVPLVKMTVLVAMMEAVALTTEKTEAGKSETVIGLTEEVSFEPAVMVVSQAVVATSAVAALSVMNVVSWTVVVWVTVLRPWALGVS